MENQTSEKTRIQAALIGLGQMGLVFDIPPKAVPQSHALAYHLHPDIDLVAAVGVRPEQGVNLAGVAPETRFYLDVREMLDQHSPDVISICTPSHVRYELIRTIFAYRSPKLLFIEKPVALSMEEAGKIGALVAQHHCQILVNHSRRWSEGAKRIRQHIRSHEYGKLTHVHLRYTRGIYNSGSHLFDLLRFVAGTISEVKVVEQVPTNLDVREDWTYSFHFKLKDQSASGYAQAFDDRHYSIFELELYFEKGKIEYRDGGDEVRFYSVQEHPVQKGMKKLQQGEVLEGLANKASNIVLAVEHVKHIIESAETPVCTLADGVYPLCVANALIESHRQGGSWETIDIPS